MHLFGYLRCRLICVAQFYFDAGDEGTVNPVFGGSAAGLADDGAQVSLSEAHAVGIVAYLVMLGTMLGDQLEEAIEDGLLARTTAGLLVDLLLEQLVVVVHLGSYECCDGGTMIIVRGMNRLPDGVHNMCGGSDILFACRQLKVAHLSVEGRRHLSLRKGHGEIRKESHSEYTEVRGKPLGVDDGARTDIDECATREVAVLQVEVDVSLAAHDDAQTVVVDGERRPLAHQQTEHRAVAANHCQFAIHEYMLAHLREVWCENVAHSCGIHQLRLSVHNTSFFVGKDNHFP